MVAGLVITVTCFTGAILVFEKELMQAFNQQRYFNKGVGERQTADQLIAATKAANPSANITGIKVYSDAWRNAEISLQKEEGRNKGVKDGKKKGTKLIAFVDPYSAEIIELYDHKRSFFYFVMDLHRWMLGKETGKLIVGISTIIFLFILLTGIILWWPANRAILKQRLKIRSGSSFKRLNHDFHVVLGFYASIVLFVLAFTGLAWSFEWFNDAIYTVTGSSKEKPKQLKLQDAANTTILNASFNNITAVVPEASYYNFSLPKDSVSPIVITVLAHSAAHESATDTYYTHPTTGAIKGKLLFTDKNPGQRTRATFKPVHVASIWGLPSKIIGFLVCLLGTFFPVSGYIMWWNRTRKKAKAKKKALVFQQAAARS